MLGQFFFSLEVIEMPKKYVGRRNWGSHLIPFLWSLNVMRALKMRCFFA